MDAEDYSLPQATGKIRVRGAHGGRNRAKPYLRKAAKKSSNEKPKEDTEQGFLSKVSSYIVPKWISNWFTSKDKDEPEQESSSEDESESNTESQPKKTAGQSSNQLISNHVSHGRTIKNLTSTPMISNSRPGFSIMKSEVSDPLEGSSLTLRKDKPYILDGRSLLSCDNPQREHTFDRPLSREGHDNASSSTKYQFHLGTNSAQTPQRFATSRNKPSFKVSSFLSSSPLIPASSSSAFYPGRTSFGGASLFQSKSIKRQRMSPVAANVQTKKACIKPKSLSSARTGAVTSDTARKILGALERMSSPVHDASKLPSSPSSVLFNPLKRRSDFSFNQSSNQASPRPNQPPTKPLLAPNMFKIQQANKSDQSNMFATKFASGDIRPGVSVGNFKSRGLPTSFSPENDNSAGGKMKRQRQTSHFPSAAPDVEEEPVNTLPAIRQAVPLPVKSLPKFDFGLSVKGKAEKESTKTESIEKNDSKNQETTKSSSLFKFSQPEKISASIGEKAIPPVKGTFQFSTPFVKSKDTEQREKSLLNQEQVINSESSAADKNDSKTKETSSVISKINVSAGQETIKSSPKPEKSLANIWGQPKDQWECETCMVRNKSDKTSCAACETPRPEKTELNQSKVQTNTLAAMFKPALGTWECTTCMVKNKPESTECAACTEKKPASAATKVLSSTTTSRQENASTTNAFAKFAPKSGSWECETCMVRNKPEVSSCVACETLKPGATKQESVATGKTESSSKILFGLQTSTKSSTTSPSIKFGGEGIKFGSSTSEAISFGTDSKKGFTFGTNNEKSVTFGSNDGKDVTFGSNGRKGVSLGSNEGKSANLSSTDGHSVSLGTNDGKGVSFGSTEGKSVTFGSSKAVSFGSPDKKGGTGDGKSASFGTQGFLFGKTDNIAAAKDSKSTGFSFGLNNKKESSIKIDESTSIKGLTAKNNEVISKQSIGIDTKTEENNNKIVNKEADASLQKPGISKTLAFNTSSFKENSASSIQDSKSSTFPTIAQAAQAGLLKVPQSVPQDDISQDASKEQKTEPPKFSFGSSVSNGPISNTFGIQNAIAPSSDETRSNSRKVPSFNFTAASKTQDSEDNKSMISKPFSFSSSAAPEAKPSISFNFGTPKETASTSSDVAGKATVPVFAFGNSAAPTQSNLFGNSNSETGKLDVKKPFSFTSDAAKSFGSSAFQQKPQENLFKLSNQQEPTKPTENKTPIFANSIQNQSNTTTFNTSSLFKNPEPTCNQFAMSSSTAAPTGGFSFGANASQSPGGLFANPATSKPVTNNLSGTGGFSFGNTVPDTNLFTEKVAQTLSEPAKPFSFTSPVVNENASSAPGGFQFGAKSFGAGGNVFGANQQSQTPAPSAPAPSAGFNFTNSTPSGGGFSFTGNTNNNSTPMFSSGTSSVASNRPIKKAVRRKK